MFALWIEVFIIYLAVFLIGLAVAWLIWGRSAA